MILLRFNQRVKLLKEYGTAGLLYDDDGNYICGTLELGHDEDGRRLSRHQVNPKYDTSVGRYGCIPEGIYPLIITTSKRVANNTAAWPAVNGPGSSALLHIFVLSEAAKWFYLSDPRRLNMYRSNYNIWLTPDGKRKRRADITLGYLQEVVAVTQSTIRGPISCTVSDMIPLTGTFDEEHKKGPFPITYDSARAAITSNNPNAKIELFYQQNQSWRDVPRQGKLGHFTVRKEKLVRASETEDLAMMQYIRFHGGSMPSDSGGCVLLGHWYDEKGMTRIEEPYSGAVQWRKMITSSAVNSEMLSVITKLNAGFFDAKGEMKPNMLHVIDSDSPITVTEETAISKAIKMGTAIPNVYLKDLIDLSEDIWDLDVTAKQIVNSLTTSEEYIDIPSHIDQLRISVPDDTALSDQQIYPL